jgi:hypothetical protein
MDVIGESLADRLVRSIDGLVGTNLSEVEIRLRNPDVGFPVTTKALYTSPPPRSPPAKTRFKMPRRDPFQKAYVAATTKFDKMVRVTPARLIEFIEAKIADQSEIQSDQITVDSVDELFAFRYLPSLVQDEGSARIGAYRVVLEDRRTDNEWINLPAFRVERLEKRENG